MADLLAYVQGHDNNLAGSGVTLSATSATFTSLTTPDGTLLTMADFGTTGYGTFEPETTREENFSFTGLTQNANGTATLTGITRGLRFVAPYTADTALRQAHAGGSVMRFTNSAPFYSNFTSKSNDETILETWTFTSTDVPRMDAAPSYIAGSEEWLVTKRYVDGVALVSAPNASTTAKGVVQEATQAQTDARTQAGSTAADLFINPTTLRATKYHDFAASSGGTDAYAITITPAITAYADGQVFVFEADVANTGAATLNVSALGAKTIKKYGSKDLESNDIVAGSIITVAYDLDSDTFMLQTPVAKQQISQTSAEIFALDGGATDAYAITLSPAPAAYTTGMVVNFGANTANTGAATLNVNGLGAKTIKKLFNGAVRDLVTGDIIIGQYLSVIYNGTDFQMISPFVADTNTLVNSYNFGSFTAATTGGIAACAGTGFSDTSTTDVIGLGYYGNSNCYSFSYPISPDVGHAVYQGIDSQITASAGSSAATTYVIQIGSDYWVDFDDSAPSHYTKSGSAVTISGTARHGALGHDATNSLLLVLYSTTKIAKFSGISGTTITNTVADVTLDTAVSKIGFVYDDTNDQYVCVDLPNNLLRKFNSSGTTVETVAYTTDDSAVSGCALIGGRYYLIATKATSFGGTNNSNTQVAIIPTAMLQG